MTIDFTEDLPDEEQDPWYDTFLAWAQQMRDRVSATAVASVSEAIGTPGNALRDLVGAVGRAGIATGGLMNQVLVKASNDDGDFEWRSLDAGPEGDSAYQVAVDNGFVGNVTAWLASLKGVKGDTGDTGATGDIGVLVNLGNVTGAINLSSYTMASQVFRLTATGALTLAPAGMPAVPSGKGGSFSLRIQQDGTGGRALTLDAAIKTSFGIDPISPSTSTGTDLWVFMWTGVEWVATQAAVSIA